MAFSHFRTCRLEFAVPQSVYCRDYGHEVDGLNGLRELRLESCREDSSPIFGARGARQRDRGEKTSVFSFILPNLLDQLVPVLAR